MILNLSKKLTALPNTLNSGVPVKLTSTSNSPSAVNLPTTLTVSLHVVASFYVIPAELFSCKNISLACGSAFLFPCNEKFCSVVDITFNELLAFPC